LQEEDKLMEIVQLVGSDALPEREQLTLEVARLIREFILQQNAYHEVDTYCDLKKSYKLMKTVLFWNDTAMAALGRGAGVKAILATKAKTRIGNAKFEKDHEKLLDSVKKDIEAEFKSLR
jgi:V/A-type H+-transporting ATPase subunit A